MKYKITKQYAKDIENFLAEFSVYNDAIFFIERKLLADEEKGITLIYRLYDDQKLIKEFNKEKITSRIHSAQYAEGDRDLPDSVGSFKVGREDQEISILAIFTDLSDAELFVEDMLTHTVAIITYCIFNKDTLLIKMNQRIKKNYQ